MPKMEVVMAGTTVTNIDSVSFDADRAFDPITRKCAAEPNIDFVTVSRRVSEPVKDMNFLWERLKKKEKEGQFKVTLKFYDMEASTKAFRTIELDQARIIRCDLASNAGDPAIRETITLAVEKVIFHGEGEGGKVEIVAPKAAS